MKVTDLNVIVNTIDDELRIKKCSVYYEHCIIGLLIRGLFVKYVNNLNNCTVSTHINGCVTAGEKVVLTSTVTCMYDGLDAPKVVSEYNSLFKMFAILAMSAKCSTPDISSYATDTGDKIKIVTITKGSKHYSKKLRGVILGNQVIDAYSSAGMRVIDKHSLRLLLTLIAGVIDNGPKPEFYDSDISLNGNGADVNLYFSYNDDTLTKLILERMAHVCHTFNSYLLGNTCHYNILYMNESHEGKQRVWLNLRPLTAKLNKGESNVSDA